jgi:hypothetical protein
MTTWQYAPFTYADVTEVVRLPRKGNEDGRARMTPHRKQSKFQCIGVSQDCKPYNMPFRSPSWVPALPFGMPTENYLRRPAS